MRKSKINFYFSLFASLFCSRWYKREETKESQKYISLNEDFESQIVSIAVRDSKSLETFSPFSIWSRDFFKSQYPSLSLNKAKLSAKQWQFLTNRTLRPKFLPTFDQTVLDGGLGRSVRSISVFSFCKFYQVCDRWTSLDLPIQGWSSQLHERLRLEGLATA